MMIRLIKWSLQPSQVTQRINPEIPAVSGVQAKDQDRVETVTYRKDAQKAIIRYVSTNGNRVLTTDEVTGKSGEAIAYSTTSQITEFKETRL